LKISRHSNLLCAIARIAAKKWKYFQMNLIKLMYATPATGRSILPSANWKEQAKRSTYSSRPRLRFQFRPFMARQVYFTLKNRGLPRNAGSSMGPYSLLGCPKFFVSGFWHIHYERIVKMQEVVSSRR